MATNPIRLTIDRQARQIVQFNGSAPALPALFQGNVPDFEIQIVDPTGAQTGPAYTAVDVSAFGLRVAVGDTPTGSSGGPTPLTIQTSWTWDSTRKLFVGNLALNTGAIDTFIGTLATKPAYFEVNLTIAGNRSTQFQGTFALNAVVDEATSVAPTPTDSYMTKNEIIATFQKKIGAAGEWPVVTSPDGTSWSVEFAVNNDGSLGLNAIKIT